jgi:hypothetical protein
MASRTDTKKAYTMVVLTNPVAGKEKEYNDWYDNRHIPDVLAVPGFVGAQRFKLVVNPGEGEPPWRYYAVYQMATDDPKAAIDDVLSRWCTDKMPNSDSLDEKLFFGVYEAITPFVTKSA